MQPLRAPFKSLLKETARNPGPPRRALCSHILQKASGQRRYKPSLQSNLSPPGRWPQRHTALLPTCCQYRRASAAGRPQQRRSVPQPLLTRSGRCTIIYSARYTSAFLVQVFLISVKAKSKMFKDPPHMNPRVQQGHLELGGGREVTGHSPFPGLRGRRACVLRNPLFPSPPCLLCARGFTHIPHATLVGPPSPFSGIHVGLAKGQQAPPYPVAAVSRGGWESMVRTLDTASVRSCAQGPPRS